MAHTVMLKNPQTGILKKGYYGFSWTFFFFGGLVSIFRGALVRGVIEFAAAVFLVLMSLWFFPVYYLITFIWSFFYNKHYTLSLIENGYQLTGDDASVKKARIALGIVQSTASGGSTTSVLAEKADEPAVSPNTNGPNSDLLAIEHEARRNRTTLAMVVIAIGFVIFVGWLDQPDNLLGKIDFRADSGADAPSGDGTKASSGNDQDDTSPMNVIDDQSNSSAAAATEDAYAASQKDTTAATGTPPEGTASSTSTSTPGFNCQNANNVTEIAICKNENLADLDAEYSEKYHSVSEYLMNVDPAEFYQVRDRARQFLRRRDTCDSSVDCIANEYESMITYLSGFGVGAAAKTGDTTSPNR